jgi:hypothetical protein
VLEGSAGIGKTTLWLAGVAEARERGSLMLVTRAAEAEARMSYAALGDLLAGVPDKTFDELPRPLSRTAKSVRDPTGTVRGWRCSRRLR